MTNKAMNIRRINREFVLKIFLVAALVGFIAYGVSLFYVKPTTETITTSVPTNRKANVRATDVDYKR